MKKCLIDAGPIIALFDKDDQYHAKAVDFLRNFNGRLVTSWAVITEVMYMLNFSNLVQLDFLKWVERGALEIPNIEINHLTRIRNLSEKYNDIPMDFADATLIIISELYQIEDIITIDSDFNIYKNIYKKSLNNLLWAK